MATRNATLYVSSQLYRWLGWIADMKEQDGSSGTPDAIAEDLLRRAILINLPGIEAAESDYWRARKKLDEETVAKLNAVAPLQEAIENL